MDAPMGKIKCLAYFPLHNEEKCIGGVQHCSDDRWYPTHAIRSDTLGNVKGSYETRAECEAAVRAFWEIHGPKVEAPVRDILKGAA